uniref:Uncharacterized protein n=1 Tax=Tanacetum cinerariifolium TaxID=118510 RepID=A0A699GYZ5_TANCI|nr:hypothetical protein [Tanacetum cinerariifolium]
MEEGLFYTSVKHGLPPEKRLIFKRAVSKTRTYRASDHTIRTYFEEGSFDGMEDFASFTRRASKSSFKISSMTSILKHVSSFNVKKGSSQDEENFAIFFHFENNKIGRKGLRVSRDSFAYEEYGIRLMLALISAKELQEKVLKLHGIRKLLGSLSFGGTLFWIIAELSSLKKAAEICLILCLLLMSSLRNLP